MAIRCERCSYRNTDDADHCARCETPLSPAAPGVSWSEVTTPAPVLTEAPAGDEEQHSAEE